MSWTGPSTCFTARACCADPCRLLVMHYEFPHKNCEETKRFLEKWLLKEDLEAADKTLREIMETLQGKFKQGHYKLEMDFFQKSLRGIKHAWQLAQRDH